MGSQMHITNDQLRERFNYHQPNTPEKVGRHQSVRAACFETARVVVEVTGPMSREQSLAITKLEEAMFWANAAIAREVGS